MFKKIKETYICTREVGVYYHPLRVEILEMVYYSPVRHTGSQDEEMATPPSTSGRQASTQGWEPTDVISLTFMCLQRRALEESFLGSVGLSVARDRRFQGTEKVER